MPVFQKLLGMLLSKCAPLRCSASELLELPELKERIQKFNKSFKELASLRDEERKIERA